MPSESAGRIAVLQGTLDLIVLRTLQTMAEISVEKNSTIIFPAQFMTTVQEAIKIIRGDGSYELR